VKPLIDLLHLGRPAKLVNGVPLFQTGSLVDVKTKVLELLNNPNTANKASLQRIATTLGYLERGQQVQYIKGDSVVVTHDIVLTPGLFQDSEFLASFEAGFMEMWKSDNELFKTFARDLRDFAVYKGFERGGNNYGALIPPTVWIGMEETFDQILNKATVGEIQNVAVRNNPKKYSSSVGWKALKEVNKGLIASGSTGIKIPESIPKNRNARKIKLKNEYPKYLHTNNYGEVLILEREATGNTYKVINSLGHENFDDFTFAARSIILQPNEQKDLNQQSIVNQVGTSMVQVPKQAMVVENVTTPQTETKLMKQNIFTVTPIQSADKKAIIKASVANKFIGFGEGIEGSSTENYRQEVLKQSKNNIEISTQKYTRQSVENDVNTMYLFTDNAGRTSGSNSINPNSWYADAYGKNKKFPTMTQAVIRGLNNAYPITTMIDDKRTQWTDDKFEQYKAIIDDEINQIKENLSKFKGIKFASQNPFGKGKISNMKETAPKIWKYLNEKLAEIGIDNTGNTPKAKQEVTPSTEVKTKIGSSKKINIYAGTGENAELSNFAIRPFTIGGDVFQSVEQYFQYQKWNYLKEDITQTEFQEDQKIADAIMNTSNGASLKSLGRKFKSLDRESWDKTASREMKIALLESFKQNPDALAKLLATGNAELTHTQDKGKWGTEFPKLLIEVRSELNNQPSDDLISDLMSFSKLTKNQQVRLKNLGVSEEEFNSLIFEEQKQLIECYG